ncbi:hypothetical protein LZG75_11475 [Polynucleobacter sp. IMCC30063]|uniref:hypothetical protein n=1 Tax=Polynucleobacter sp. IMCC30063 TaxID=2907298 RepID=UPI001F3BF7E3|nr:hypothetical protein [Polynucleobacter sp. IMCC30063]MCE7506855.1 hypothetical protein [Polynucleobacter sp. IMCC30063]
MSDDNDSGGIIGTIISVLILAAIWPYLLALLGIYIAYMVVLAILAWIAENWILTTSFISGILAFYFIFKYKLISKAWKYAFAEAQQKPIEVALDDFPGGCPIFCVNGVRLLQRDSLLILNTKLI